jgi:hypothetical protein
VNVPNQNLKIMKTKNGLFIAFIALTITSCGTLTSTTSIEGKNSFVLGNNKHGVFSVRLKNISKSDVIVHRAPIEGGRHSFETVTPGKTVKVKVEKNTALVIDNQGLDQVSVELYVIGDTGLSMGYKN